MITLDIIQMTVPAEEVPDARELVRALSNSDRVDSVSARSFFNGAEQRVLVLFRTAADIATPTGREELVALLDGAFDAAGVETSAAEAARNCTPTGDSRLEEDFALARRTDIR